MTHSIFSPSKAHIWTKCTCYADKGSSYAGKVGTEYHEMAQRALTEDILPEYPVRAYVDYVKSLEGRRFVEKAIPLKWLKPEILEESKAGYGYCDAFVFTEKCLEVIDLKTGRIGVSPKNNMQLAIYAYCILQEWDLKSVRGIVLTIFQDNQPKKWEITRQELEDFIRKEVEKGVYLILSGAKVREKGDYCVWCENKAECPAFRETKDNLTPIEIIKEAKRWQELAEKVKSGIKSGELIDDHLEIRTSYRYKWKKDVEIPRDFYKEVPVTPNHTIFVEYSELIDEVPIEQVWCKDDV